MHAVFALRVGWSVRYRTIRSIWQSLYLGMVNGKLGSVSQGNGSKIFEATSKPMPCDYPQKCHTPCSTPYRP